MNVWAQNSYISRIVLSSSFLGRGLLVDGWLDGCVVSGCLFC